MKAFLNQKRALPDIKYPELDEYINKAFGITLRPKKSSQVNQASKESIPQKDGTTEVPSSPNGSPSMQGNNLAKSSHNGHGVKQSGARGNFGRSDGQTQTGEESPIHSGAPKERFDHFFNPIQPGKYATQYAKYVI